eukprot:10555149-Alexandrium_andersonii.AAC.1
MPHQERMNHTAMAMRSIGHLFAVVAPIDAAQVEGVRYCAHRPLLPAKRRRCLMIPFMVAA